MGKRTIITCDFCGKTIDRFSEYYDVTKVQGVVVGLPKLPRSLIMCEKCAESLVRAWEDEEDDER